MPFIPIGLSRTRQFLVHRKILFRTLISFGRIEISTVFISRAIFILLFQNEEYNFIPTKGKPSKRTFFAYYIFERRKPDKTRLPTA
ncbi:hypothetical protein CH380_03635 [Leptospira adleri]|uniref:Uncharacterized protein n=1 Tax=Leptospira adleri TaxID=2023186 RepID=A0A2M9YTF1_9LEPT|nr:hypothetical protein CH380_03635 [Leptospira adleri]PJZ59995.1 hypothetical protein CH376_20755 [Leptospira adleri]